MKKQVYLGATLGSRGARMMNETYQAMITQAGGTPYLAQNNKSINDKKNVVAAGLAERILEADCSAIDNSDAYLFDILETPGTTLELGYITAQKRQAKMLIDSIQGGLEAGESPEEVLTGITAQLEHIVSRPVVATCTDLRSENKRPQEGFEREWSINQMVNGAVKYVTNGDGFTDFDDVTGTLKNKLK